MSVEKSKRKPGRPPKETDDGDDFKGKFILAAKARISQLLTCLHLTGIKGFVVLKGNSPRGLYYLFIYLFISQPLF